MNPLLYKIVSPLVKAIVGKGIIGKPYQDADLRIFYEKQQHLNFAFKSRVVYEKIISDQISKHIKKGNLVFDIGSNIGQYALFFSDKVGAKGRVCCYEPDFNNFAFLNFNVNINDLQNVTITKAGLGEKPGNATFFRDTNTGGRRGSLIKDFVGESFRGNTTEVAITTIKEEIKKYGIPDFMKIDVEGLEHKVLKGLGIPDPKTTFFIEVRGETKEEVFSFFKNHGFSCTLLEPMPGTEVSQAADIPNFSNLLFTHE